MYVYLGLHDSYSLAWLFKVFVFPDKFFTQKATVGSLVFLTSAISLYRIVWWSIGVAEMFNNLLTNDSRWVWLVICWTPASWLAQTLKKHSLCSLNKAPSMVEILKERETLIVWVKWWYTDPLPCRVDSGEVGRSCYSSGWWYSWGMCLLRITRVL
jgi:hypothetical protein